MAKPTIPYWDKNQTHLVAPLAGHINDGYGTDEVPASDEFNGQLNEVGKSIAFLQQRIITDALRELIPLVDSSVLTETDPEFTRQSTNTSCIYALAVTGGSAYLKQGSANNKLKIAPGVLMQYLSGELLAYEFDGTNEVTIANGDATNPRVDIVQMTLGRNATTMAPTVVLDVKQGAAAASPIYPTVDAGKCVVAAVVVGATYAAAAGFVLGEDTAGAVAVLHDQRIPLGVRPHVVMPKHMMFGTDWALQNTDTTLRKVNNTAGNAIFVPCPYGGYTGRLLGVGQNLLDKNSQDPRLIRLKHYDVTGSANALDIALADPQIGGSGSASYGYRKSAISNNGVTNFQSQAWNLGGGIPVVQANAAGIGPPIWTNGLRCPRAPFADSSDGSFPISHSYLYLMWVAPGTADLGSIWGPATWWIAGGL